MNQSAHDMSKTLQTLQVSWIQDLRYTYPSEKYEFVSWDDEIPNIWENKKHLVFRQKHVSVYIYTSIHRCMYVCIYIYIYIYIYTCMYVCMNERINVCMYV
jgi:hypothetical protein